MSSASKLLEQHSYKDVTVLDIVSDSGVNRNTFYYHFKDMPALVEAIARRGIDRVFAESGMEAAEKLEALADSLYSVRKTAMHIFSYADRNIVDKGLYILCAYVVKNAFEEDDENIWLYINALYGIASAALVNGLQDSDKGNVKTMLRKLTKS